MKNIVIMLIASALSVSSVLAQGKKTSKLVAVGQGEVAKWAGNCQRCSFETRAWAAVNGTCYYPVDMEKKPGTYTISRRTTGGKLETAKLTVQTRACEKEDFDNFPKTEYIKVSAANLARATREAAQLRPMLVYQKNERPAVFDLPLGKPASPLPKSEGNFGACRTFNGQPRDRHTGLDYPVTGNALSVGNGRVIVAANNFYSGNAVFISHGNGLTSEYFHLKALGVKPGQTVKKGETIGEIGETGRVTGPHLHLGVRWHGARINPAQLLLDPAVLPEVR
jgi:murein DD-endopeptidase MepM/ murein hydrolase activator NlpD